MMNLLFIVFCLSSAFVASVEAECQPMTKLNFFESELVNNTLHLAGGQLIYQDIGTFYNESIEEGIEIDLRVTVTHGNYTNIADYWAARNKTAEQVNGKRDGGKFGNINLQTKKGVANSGEGNFRFCIVKTGTTEPVELREFTFTIWDLDERKRETGRNGISVKEKLIMNTTQAASYSLFPNFNDSQVEPICEDGSPVVCAEGTCACPTGVRTVFHSSEFGIGPDNPKDPEHVTDLQKRRAVLFYFQNTSCWDFTYDHYCPVDQADYTGSETKCRMGEYSGGNFLFAGESGALGWHREGCSTEEPRPTPAPTACADGPPFRLWRKQKKPKKCRWYAKKRKCNKKTPEGSFVWELCQKSCGSCGKETRFRFFE